MILKLSNPVAVALLAALLFCGGQGTGAPQRADSRPAPALPPLLGLTPDPAREPIAPARPQLRAAGAGILLRYAGASFAPPELERSKDEARTLAAGLAILARSKGADFASLASQFSDDAVSRAQGGFLGTFRFRRDTSGIARVLMAIDIGCVAGPVDAPEGFYILKRVPIEELSFRGILVSWGGADPTGRVLRTKDEAHVRAEELWERIRNNPAAFDDLVERESDDPLVPEKHGYVSPAPRGEIHADLESALLKTKVGECAPPVETPKGYVLFKRIAVVWATFDALLVQYRDAQNAGLKVVRSRDEAKARAESILELVRKPGCDFGALVKEYSDDEADQIRAGRRSMGVSAGSPPFVQAVIDHAEGESFIVESKLGFHVMRRVTTTPE
jgi:hypothetical protein